MEYKIPNFSYYTIDDDLVVRSYSRGEGRTLKGCGNGCYGLRSDDKQSYQCHAPKLLWCAKNNVNPMDVQVRDLIITKKYGVIERSEMFRKIGENCKIQNTLEEQVDAIKLQIEEASTLLNCLETNDYSWLLNKLHSMEYDTASLLVSLNRATPQTAKEIAHEAIKICVDRFCINHQPIYNVKKFYTETAKSLAKVYRSTHKHFKGYGQNKFGCIFGSDGTVLNLKR